MNLGDVLKRFDESNIQRVKVGIFDIDGMLRGKYISRRKFEASVVSGLGFRDVIFGWDSQDVLYRGVSSGLGGWDSGFPDATARIDLESFRLIPWEPGTAFFLLDLYGKDGEPFPLAPRQLFRAVESKAAALGYDAHFAAEYEFLVFRETPATLREKGYRDLITLAPARQAFSIARLSAHTPLILDILDLLNSFHVPIESLHAEDGPGAFEAALHADKGVAAPDKAALFKSTVKEIAARHQLTATFMAKCHAELPGNGGHIHQSLWDHDKETNLFHAGEAHMSDLMEHYIAGLVKYLPELIAMLCPTTNSYARLIPESWAPVNATWGIDNRTVAVRALPAKSRSTRIEMRAGGADANPYLAMAACLAAGLEGIDEQLDLPDKTANGYAAHDASPLPRTLDDATARLRNSDIARRWFGDSFVEHYAATREWESRQCDRTSPTWELARYFESV